MSSTAAGTPEERRFASTAWWLLLVTGALAIILGLVAMIFTSATLNTILVFFAIFSILVGVVSLFGGLRGRNSDNSWGWLLFQGVASLVIGIVVLRFPDQTAAVFGLIVAFWALAIGIIRLVGAFDLKKAGAKSWGWSMAAGAVTLIFGLIFLVNPGFAAETVVFLLGLMALITGIVIVIEAAMTRKTVDDFADDGIINQSNA
jgi:uncharacterized membrane protein HdeD (DUF308 family)